jgi:hypothetical protein
MGSVGEEDNPDANIQDAPVFELNFCPSVALTIFFTDGVDRR